jgi:hypothetical protein
VQPDSTLCRSLTQSLAIHAVIYTARTFHLLQSSQDHLTRAVKRWRQLWDDLRGTGWEDQKKPIGFERYCLELLWLADKILEIGSSGEDGLRSLNTAPRDSPQGLRQFLDRYAADG